MKKQDLDLSGRRARRFATAALALAFAGCNLYFGSPEEWKAAEKAECLAELADDAVFNDAFPLLLGDPVKADTPPPAISGGTIALSPDESIAVASDPDRDMVYVVSLDTYSVLATIPMEPQDEPGRVIIDDSQRAHVALRRGNKVVSIDLTTNTVIGRYKACASPRGIDFDEVSGLLYVACHSGKLVSMDPATGSIVSQTRIEPGLRDVVVTPDYLYVSKFRTAELFVLDRDGELLATMIPPTLETRGFDFETEQEVPNHFSPNAAWRTIENPAGGVVMVHQRGKDDEVKPSPGGYGGGDPCQGGVVHAAVTPMEYGQEPPTSTSLNSAVLPVDITLIHNNNDAVVVAAGNGAGDEQFIPSVMDVPVHTMHQDFDCFFGGEWGVFGGQPTAAASTQDDTVIIQLREPAELRIFVNDERFEPIVVPLSTQSMRDTGHQLFHLNTGSNVACASCHLEGADDSRVWRFKCIGDRRTQTINFGIKGTAPFHWDGDMTDFGTLMNEVFVGRMGGAEPTQEQMEAVLDWVDTMRPTPRVEAEDQEAYLRGQALFNSPAVGCSGCHSGPNLIGPGAFNVGTGGTFQVPSLLGIADRDPYLHSGCASTLRERFTNPACGGGDQHGSTSQLTPQQLDDLILYLETL